MKRSNMSGMKTIAVFILFFIVGITFNGWLEMPTPIVGKLVLISTNILAIIALTLFFIDDYKINKNE